MRWSGREQRGFVIGAFFKNGDSVIATQRVFRTYFQLGRRAKDPSWNTILRWMDSVHATGSTLKKKPPRRPKTVRTPVNVEEVRQSVLRSPERSVSCCCCGWVFYTFFNSQIISVVFYIEREKYDKFCSEALISA